MLEAPVIDDNCGGYTIKAYVDDIEIDPETHEFGNGTTIVKWVVTDAGGNMAMCEQQVIVHCWPSVYVYVDHEKTGGAQTGVDWANALLRIEDALEIAALYPGIEEIWVAEGEYKLPAGSSRDASFELVGGVKLMGGFNGVVEHISDRTPFTLSVMSGDIGSSGDAGDNCYHVVTAGPSVTGAVIDGFTISDGNANGSLPDNCGAGVLNEGEIMLINCIISECISTNPGRAVHNHGTGQITIRGTTILQD
jgi:hypothetical protein